MGKNSGGPDMWSVRMRAERDGRHVSGGERLVKEGVEGVILELCRKPRDYDKMVITIESVRDVQYINKALPIYSYDFDNVKQAREFAVAKLVDCGVCEGIAWGAVELLTKGPNPKGGNMRGAVLMDIKSGERLEDDQERGVRTVRIDWENRKGIEGRLKDRGIKPHYLHRLMDALAIATKNVYCGVVAELCWSDDRDYVTGYVAGKDIGYVRIKPMKEMNIPIGGRVYFVDRDKLECIKNCLESQAVILREL